MSCSLLFVNVQKMSASEFSLPASLRYSLQFCVGAYTLFIVWASLRPAGTGMAIQHLDKLVHFLVYAALAFGVSLAWPRLPKIRVFWLCALFGAALEVAQGLLTAGRTASGWDAVANSFGTALGVLVAIGLSRIFAR